MKQEITELAITPLGMEVIPVASDRKTLSFRTLKGYLALTDAADIPDGDHSIYYDVNEAAYEDDRLSLYFASDAPFREIYDVVTLHWPINEKVIDFLAGHLFFGTPLKLALHMDGKSRMQ